MEKKDTEKEEATKKRDEFARDISLGLCLGVMFGIVFDSISTWLPIGLCLGAAYHLQRKKRNNKKKENNDNDISKQ